MIVAFVRHGAPRNNEADPELTSFGHRMALETGHWLKGKGFLPDVCFSTNTRRTIQTAENLILGCQSDHGIIVFDMPESEENLFRIQALLAEKSSAKIAFVCCHQPFLENIKRQYSPKGPPIRFATALIMRYSDGQWNCIDSWPGRPSY